tara:strand:- start:1280 stop:3694 length:2415 start_codon:yes stop_codon:yes gene_type:complete
MSIDNCVSSNYLRRACTDSSSVGGGGNVNKNNLCSTLNDVACDVTFSSLTVTGASSLNNVTATGLSTLHDLTVTNDTLLNNVTATGLSTFYDLTVTNETLLNNGTFTGDIKINNLTVTGTQYIEHRQNLYIGDPLITLNSGVAGANTYDIGWIGERGSSINIGTIWDESDDEFALVTTTGDGSTDSVTISSYEKLKLGSIESTGRVGIATDTPIGDLSVSGSTYSEKIFHTGSDGSWLQLGTGEQITLGALSVTTASAGTAALSYNNSNGVFSYTPPATGTMASETASDYVLGTATGSLASQTANITDYVLKTATGSMASQTATNYVLGSATGSLASQTANITDYVLKTATGSMASKTDTDYVLGSATGCAASKSCEYFTGQLFGYQTGSAQTLDNGDSPVWNTATSSWSYGPGGGGAGIALTDLSVTVASAGTANLGYNNSNGVFTYTPPATGTMASQTAANYVLGSATGSMASQTATNYVLGTATGSMASKTATNYVLGTATGSMASKTATNYVLGTATGSAAPLDTTNVAFTGSLFGDGFKAGETFVDGYTPVWESASSQWLLQANSAGGTPPGGSTTEIQFNNAGAFGGSSWFTANSATGFFTVGKADLGRWPADGDYAFFGHTDLDHADHNYALLQASDGTTFLSASTDKCLRFREGATDVAMISGGAMRIGNGGLPSGTAGSLVVENDVIAFYTSDERLKDNVAPIASGLNKISHLTGVQFDWNKDSYAHLQGHDIGVIAQNIESVVPEAVSTRPDGYKAVRYDKIVPVLIEGMKEQQIQIQNLQTEVDSLKYWLESV